MKTIVIATDFSKAAEDAMIYAASLTRYLNTKLIIFNTFHIPVSTAHVPTYIPNMEELEEDSRNRLEKLSMDISTKFDIEAEGFSCHGFAVDELKKLVRKKDIGLVVMGMKGESNLRTKLFGSLTTDIIREGSFPVLVIPEDTRFEVIKGILFACDSSRLSLQTDLTLLREIAMAFNAEIQILQVVKELVMPRDEAVQSAPLSNLESILTGIKQSYHVVEDDDIVDGIEEAMDDLDSDLLVMAPHKPGFWDKIFNSGNTREMALRTYIPLLALPKSSL